MRACLVCRKTVCVWNLCNVCIRMCCVLFWLCPLAGGGVVISGLESSGAVIGVRVARIIW